MMHDLKELHGIKLAALDGAIGQVRDFYFDDQSWVIRYLVADTGSWLTERLVLLSPHAFGKFNPLEGSLHLKLQKKQIEHSPSLEPNQPLTRQYEAEYYRYYGWPAYWSGGARWGEGGFPLAGAPSRGELAAHPRSPERDDRRLQSVRAITNYHLEAVDGTIGQVGSLIVDDRTWAVRDLVVETGHWFSGRKVLVSPGNIVRISHEESKAFLNLTKLDMQAAVERVAAAGT